MTENGIIRNKPRNQGGRDYGTSFCHQGDTGEVGLNDTHRNVRRPDPGYQSLYYVEMSPMNQSADNVSKIY